MSSSPASTNGRRLLTLAAILAAFAVRLFHLGAESLWYDETVSVYLARLPLPAMLAHTAGDIHPPGYYALLHAWHTLTSPTLAHGLEFLYAFPSVFFGVLALPLLYAIGRRLFGVRTGLAALWLGVFAPFLVWYSQEVRMYILGAFLGLLCFWALLKFTAPAGSMGSDPGGERSDVKVGWLVVYVLAAAAGLYTLYYFLFLLIALNLAALLDIWLQENGEASSRLHRISIWLAAQLAVLLLWLPWIPTFWRQATDPPVPPWRTPWASPTAVLQSLAETLAALIVGQSPPGGITWPWAVVTTLLLAGTLVLAVTRAGRRTTDRARTRLWLSIAAVLLCVFVPIAILFAATLLGTPIYHVRYLALYAPLFLLLPAWLIVNAARLRTWLGAAMWVGLLAISALALFAFWTNPIYRADDHRAAVANLAQRWRPGDAILANAGWIYPILTTYWPDGSAHDAAVSLMGTPAPLASGIPPSLQPPFRLLDYAQNAPTLQLAAPLIVRSGSVDGPGSLGWGDPASDFFAISQADTIAALDALAQNAHRIWHYRLYDTVSDPNGAIRSWLATNTMTVTETPVSGRDFGQVQLFATPLGAPRLISGTATAPLATFGAAVALSVATVPPTVTAGSYLYADFHWRALPHLAELPADLSVSLRLYDANNQLVAQADTPLHELPTHAWDPDLLYPQPAALPIASSLAPGLYSPAIVVYRQDNAEALPADATGEQVWKLGKVEVLPLY
jgi:uncharacterized membrane protein